MKWAVTRDDMAFGIRENKVLSKAASFLERSSCSADVVFAKRPLGTSKGRLVWREPLVWAAAGTFDPVPGAALPLALYLERSVFREAAFAALHDKELNLGDRLYQPQFCRRARRGTRGPPHSPP